MIERSKDRKIENICLRSILPDSLKATESANKIPFSISIKIYP